jgi:hypothetical protein
MLGALLQDGVEITNDPAQADAVIVNTCSFIDAAQEESVDAILESAEVRAAKNRGQSLIVSGCLPQRFREELPKLLPEVDAFMGIDQVAQVADIVKQAVARRAERIGKHPTSNIQHPTSNLQHRMFQAALNHVCLELAKMIVRDGEGVHRVVTVRVNGAKTIQDADAAARAVANSPLVKTSWHGGDPNWGRIIDALGYSPAKIVEEKVDIGYSLTDGKTILWSLKRGQPTKATFKQLCAAVAPKEFDLHVNLNLGKAGAVIYAADLTEEYVDFNKGDVGDPGLLGG